MPDIDFTPVMRALATALVPFVREALGSEGLDPVTGVLTEDNFDPSDWGLMTEDTFDASDHGLLTENDFDPDTYGLVANDDFDPSDHDLVTCDDLHEAIGDYLTDRQDIVTTEILGTVVEEAIDEALSNLSITRD